MFENFCSIGSLRSPSRDLRCGSRQTRNQQVKETIGIDADCYLGVGLKGYFRGRRFGGAGLHLWRFADGTVAVVADCLTRGPFPGGFHFDVVALPCDHTMVNEGGYR